MSSSSTGTYLSLQVSGGGWSHGFMTLWCVCKVRYLPIQKKGFKSLTHLEYLVNNSDVAIWLNWVRLNFIEIGLFDVHKMELVEGFFFFF